MNRTLLTPLLVLAGIVALCTLMAVTPIFDPLIQFIHTGVITPVQAITCLVFTGAGFATSFYLLNLVCSYFVPRIDTQCQNNAATIHPK